MIRKLFKILNTDVTDLYFNWKTRKCYSKISEEFNLIKDGTVKMKYNNTHVSVAGLSSIDDYEFLYNARLVKKPTIITNSVFLDFDNAEKLSIIAHELGHYDFFCSAPSLGCTKRRALWNLTYYTDRDYFDFFLANGADIKILDYLSKYVHNDKRKARLKKWNLMKELYADNKAIESGYGERLLDVLNKLYERFGSMINDKDVVLKRIKNLEGKLREQ